MKSEVGWTPSKISRLFFIALGSIAGGILYFYGFRLWQNEGFSNAKYWIIIGFGLHILSMVIAPQLYFWRRRRK